MNTKHTPGPWTVGDPLGHPLTIMWGGDKGSVVNGDGIGDDCELNRANARLIAAAPELLAACKEAEEWIEGWASAEPYLTIIKDAIAKAEGRSPSPGAIPMSVFEKLYASEINCEVSSFWDGGWSVKLGDGMNGFVAEATVETWQEVGPWLRQAAIEHYPLSKFACEETGREFRSRGRPILISSKEPSP